jgi:hypothetical protein
MLLEPVSECLAGGNHVLLVGCGGGYHVFGGVPPRGRGRGLVAARQREA